MRSGRLLCTAAVLLLSVGLLTGCEAEEKAAGQVPVAAPVTTVETTPSVEVTPSEVAPTPVEASTAGAADRAAGVCGTGDGEADGD
ncbi:hypothetical protein [Kribbella monticola]|uniref:hypothetical protein n=1 Tax=Kribbella monticola TaxID=2185285 RepID=UPI001300BDC9|nr:hypothetical protein [Kribbella monticola]